VRQAHSELGAGLDRELAVDAREVRLDSDTLVRANLVRGAGHDDYSVGALGDGTVTGTLLTGNLALGAAGDGFHIYLPGTTLTRDLAFHNGDLGIDAVAGTIDGGGNRAHANGNPAQCVGVSCG
jgi:hypothetical protein